MRPFSSRKKNSSPLDDELDRPGAPVADRPAERDRCLEDRGAQALLERGGGRLLEHLLVPALHRAVALAEGDDVPVRVGEELDLDVARALEVALAVERPVPERARGLALGRGERLVEVRRVAHDAHAPRRPRRPPP